MTATPKATAVAGSIQISTIGTRVLQVPIAGTAPLIVHNWSAKAKRQMLDAMQGVKKVKQPKDPVTEYEASLYRIATDDGEQYGFPVLAFKAATTDASLYYDKSVPKTLMRRSLFFKGVLTKADPQQLVRITGEPEMREDMVTVGVSGTDLRYRATFPEWSATLTVVYVTSALSEDSVISLIDAGGMGIGVGEWRPQRSGEFGTYMVDPDRPVVSGGNELLIGATK